MRYASVCDGIGAAHLAFRPLGWECAWTSEIDKFPIAVVEQRWGLPNLGDMLEITDEQIKEAGPIDLLCGGTPCQSFSVAGLREGLADPRGNLALSFLGLADRTRPKWLVWENVPGLLSINEGRDFGAFLGAMGELGYGFAYRILDAQHFGVPQRRRRVFVVGHLGDWRRAAAVLFERESMSGNPAPRRQAGESAAPTLAARSSAGGGLGTDDELDGGLIANPLTRRMHKGINTTCDEGQTLVIADPVCANEQRTYTHEGKNNFRLRNVVLDEPPVLFDETQLTHPANYSNPQPGDPSHPLAAGGRPPTLSAGNLVRRLCPRECERLQGMPDDYTLIEYRGGPAKDGPRYKALGNSWAVPVVAWIGGRIDALST